MNIIKNKKILVLVGKISGKKTTLLDIIKENIGPGFEVSMDIFSNLSFEFERNNVTVKISGVDVKQFDLVYIRSIDPKLSFLAGVLSYCLDFIGIKYIDTKFRNSRATSDKLTSLVILSLNDLPTMPSFFCSQDKIVDNASYIVDKFGYPVVAKELMSHHSKGLFVLRNVNDFRKLASLKDSKKGRQFLFQKYVLIEKEYRFLVLGNLVRSVQRMYRDLSGPMSFIDFNRNEEFIDVNKMPKEARELAVRCAKALNIQVAGVDLLVTKKDLKFLVIEVNGNPGFSYDPSVSPEIPQLAKYLGEEASQ